MQAYFFENLACRCLWIGSIIRLYWNCKNPQNALEKRAGDIYGAVIVGPENGATQKVQILRYMYYNNIIINAIDTKIINEFSNTNYSSKNSLLIKSQHMPLVVFINNQKYSNR